MSKDINILDGLEDKEKRKTIAKKLIEQNVKSKYSIDLPVTIQGATSGAYATNDLINLINNLVDMLAESVSNP